MLAMLPAMTWTLRSWAAIPVAAVSSARIYVLLGLLGIGRQLRQLLQRVAALVALLLQDGGDVGVAPRDLDHARHLGHRVDVGFLDRALHHPGIERRRVGIDAVRRRKRRAAVFLQR